MRKLLFCFFVLFVNLFVSAQSITTGAISASSYCAGSTISVPFTTTGSFTAGNTFTAQLSDASGNFASPVTIGTLTGTTSGTITATIPTTVTTGTGYRIRVVSSSPTATGSDNGSNLTLSATPSVNDISNLVVCNGASVPVTTFTGSAGASFSWTNSNPGIGLGASGSGNIASFIATNATSSPVTATITVTPQTGRTYAYIANYNVNNVRVINTATNATVATVGTGAGPHSVTVSPDGSRVYTANQGGNSVSVINTSTNTLVTNITGFSGPLQTAISPDGSRLYVPNFNSNTVSVVNTATNTIIGSIAVQNAPLGMVVLPGGTRGYVANYSSATVSVVNLSTNTLIQNIAVGANPAEIVQSPDGSRIYVTCGNTNNISVINTTTNAVLATIPVGTRPFGIAISTDGTRVYTANQNSNNVSVINTASNAVIATIAAGATPSAVSVTPDGTRLWVANTNANSVSVIDLATNTTASTITGFSAPYTIGAFIKTLNSCTSTPKTFTITVNPARSATISYSGAPYCATGTATPTFTGTTGGMYSSTAGLSINPATGVIDLAASTPGLYTVTYSIAASDGCAAFNTTTQISIAAVPTVNDPSDLAVCAGTATGAINFSGTAGNYTWTNSNTAIGLAASGTGNISAFTPTNTTNAPITSTVTVTPVNSAEYAYVAGSNGVSVINLRTNAQEAIINVGFGPFGIAVAPNGSYAYVANQSSDNVSVINTNTNTVVATIPVGTTPYGIAVSPDGSRVYVVNSNSNTVSVINTATNSVIASVPVGTTAIGVAVSPDGTKVYVANRGSNTITVINAATNTVSATLGNVSGPFGIVFTPDGTRAYVTNQFGGSVSVFNAATNAFITTIGVGSEPRGIAVSPDGSRAYVANRLSQTASVINTATNAVIATVPAGNEAFGVSVSSDGSRAYVANQLSQNLTVINTATNTVATTIALGGSAIAFGNFIKPATNCSGTAQTFTITVNPTPAVTSAATGTVCSGTAQNYTITSGVAGTTFAWSRAAVAGISNTAATGSGETITETLTNTTSAPINVVYQITPTANGCAGTVFNYTVTVNPQTTITTQPASQTICTGSSVTFSVTASGTGLSYQWRKNGAPIGSATSASYTIPATMVADEGNYDVVVTGSCGTQVSNAATLTLNAAPAIQNHPVSQAVCAGNNVTLFIARPAGYTATGLSYQWRKNGANIAGANTSAYTINNISASDAANYDVVISSTCFASMTSNAAVITVNTPAAITTQPVPQAVCSGTSATFTVSATGAGLTYQWRKGGVNIGSATSASYTISNVTAADLGNYDVIVSGTCGTPVTSSAVALTINPATAITTQPAATTVCAGAAASFTVVATGQGTLSYQWYKDGAAISSATSATYSIATATASHAGTYKVQVTGTCGTVTSANAALTVNPLPSASVSGTATVCQGATAPAITFTGSGGTAPYTFTYTINGGAAQTVTTTSGSSVSVTASTAIPVTFAYTLVSVQDASSTTCTNTATGTATITVTATPTASLSYAASLYCASGNATPIFSGTTGGTYTSTAGLSINNITGVINLAASTPGTYTVTYTIAAAGGCSVFTTTGSIEIKKNTVITTQPTATQSVCEGNAISFTVAADGAGLTYQWRKGGTNITNATAATYTISSPTLADAASYDVVVTGDCGIETSTAAVLDVKPLTVITTQPTAKVVCEGASATFTVVATGSGTVTYQWKKDGAAITNATAATYSIPTATAAHSGTYTVDVTAACGTVASSGATLTVNPLPTASISGTTTICQNATAPSITFSGSNGTAPYTFTYTINGGANQTVTTTSGNTVTIAAPTGTPGTYIYQLVGVKDASTTTCSNTASGTATVTVTAMPTASLSYAGSPYCNTGTATPTFNGTTGGTYSSTTGLSINATTGVIDLAASTPGTYAVTYTIAAAGGCAQVTATTSVTINALTVINTQPVAQTVCIGTAVTFSVNASGTTLTYQWRKGGVNIPGATNSSYSIASTNVADEDTYDVIVSGSCGTITSNAVKLTVNTSPSIATQPSGQVLCAGASVSFSVVASGTGLTYQWQKDGVDIAGATGTTYTIAAVAANSEGRYGVVVSGTCGTLTSTAANLTVNATTAITSQPTAKVVCAGTSATFSIAASGTALTYQWRKGGMNINGATAATYTINNPATTDAGTYDVVVAGTCGVVTSTAATLTVNAIPSTLTIATSGVNTFCQGENVTLTSSAANGNQWFKDGVAITGATSQTYVATVSGNYTVRSTISNCPSALSVAVAVTVKPLPATPVISASGNILTSSAATGNQWYLNSTAINGATGVMHRVQASGLYTVRVTENGCSTLSAVYNFVATAVGAPENWNGEVSIYPNPVFQTLYVKNNTGRKLQVQLYDGLGRKVYEGQLSGTEGRIPVTGLTNGTYHLLITDVVRNKTISQSIIKL